MLEAHTFLIDPSMLLSMRRVEAMQQLELFEGAVISRAFYEGLAERDVSGWLPFADRRERIPLRLDLMQLLEPCIKFSYSDEESVPEGISIVRDRLLASRVPASEALADEWVYLTTHSWVVAARRALLAALHRAGAATAEYGGRLAHELISAVIPDAHLPSRLTRHVVLKAGIKWIITASGSAALAAVPPGIAAPLLVPIVRAFDP